MDTVPGYVSIVFIITTFVSIAFLLHASKAAGLHRFPTKILIFLLPLWIFFQAALAVGGFYQDTSSLPPRIMLFGVFPALALMILYFLLFRSSFIEQLPLQVLTLLHIVRIPVELVLYWLFLAGEIPKSMTFEGRNFDIISGILAPIVYFAAFRGQTANRKLLLGYNVLGLILLINIVSTAIVSLPSPMQTAAFDQPNRAVLFFPYVWLPTIIVPIVLFSHLAVIWKLFRSGDK